MKSKHTTTTRPATVATTEKKTVVKTPGPSLFGRENILLMLAGAALIILGYILMSGGRSDDPNVFNENEVYSTRRITIAPIVILAGLALEIFALFRNNTRKES